ncbi:hypothetical protein RB597_000426 [Gaeumannomyces tritici]
MLQLPGQSMLGVANPTYPELSSPGPKRKYGRQDYGRFDNICFDSASIGGSLLGKVNVDVGLRFAKSKWGFFRGCTPGGILYIDIDIQQQADCKIDQATVKIVLRDKESGVVSKYPTQVTPFFGPKHLTGTERLEHKESSFQLQPSVQFMGTGLSGLGGSSSAKADKVYHWDIRGQRTNSKAAAGILGLHYDTLEWKMIENKLEGRSGNKICTAFAFTHSGHEILMDVIVEGKLSSKTDRLREGVKRLKFRPNAGRKPGQISTTLIGVYSGERPQLDMLAAGLEHDMVRENYISQPVMMPKPQQSSFRQEPAGRPPETQGALTSADERAQQATPVLQQPQPLPESGSIKLLDPTVQRLLCAGQSLIRSPRDMIFEEMSDQWDEADTPSRSLSPTVVDSGRVNEILKDELPEDTESFHSFVTVEDKEKPEGGLPRPLASKPESRMVLRSRLLEDRIITENQLSILGAFAIGAVISYIMAMLRQGTTER